MSEGFCPTCEARGEVASPCQERACRLAGSHFIPEEYFERCRNRTAGPRNPMIGQNIDDYLVVDVLGAGGFGKVYLALQMPIGLKAALKVMNRDAEDAETAALLGRKFLGEAQALAALTHPNIVRLFRYGTWQESPYLVMEYVEGSRTLKREMTERVLRGEPIDTAAVPRILAQTLNALDAAHGQGIVHRDVKPDNIMLQAVSGDPWFVRVLDFGLAKFVAERTETSAAMGTPTYMAPEQVLRRNIGPWTDLYAVGVVAFELLTGKRPFEGGSSQEIVSRKIDPAYDPTAALGHMSPTIVSILKRALCREPEGRFRSAMEFRQAIESLQPPVTVIPDQPKNHPAAEDVHGRTAEETQDAAGLLGAIRGRPELEETERSERPPAPPGIEPDRTRKSSGRKWITAGALVAVLAVAGLLVFLMYPGDDSPPTPPRGPVVAAQVSNAETASPAPAERRKPSTVPPPSPSKPRIDRVTVAAAEFRMGSDPKSDPGALRSETPAHKVSVSEFKLDRIEVTVADFGACVAAGACRKPNEGGYCNWGRPDRADHPVNCVDHAQAMAYCAWAGGRLPTEAEWELAARGKDGRRFPWGDAEPDCSRAVFKSGADGCGKDRTWPAGSLPAGATPSGILDLAGNVWEWVEDCWHPDYSGVPGNGRARKGPADCARVIRGGSWVTGPKNLRGAARSSDDATSRNGNIGFRCAS